MTTEVICKFLKDLETSKTLVMKFVDSIINDSDQQTSELENMVWKTIYETPLDVVLSWKNTLNDIAYKDELEMHIKFGVGSYLKIAQYLLEKTPIRSTFLITNPRDNCHRKILDFASRCYQYSAKLHIYSNKLNIKLDDGSTAIEHLCRGYIANPSSPNILMDLAETLLPVDVFSSAFYAHKSFIIHGQESQLNNFFKRINNICNIENGDISKIDDIKIKIFLIAKAHLTKDKSSYDCVLIDEDFNRDILAFVDNYDQFNRKAQLNGFQRSSNSQGANLVFHDEIDDLTKIFSTFIFILEDLRRTDSERFETLLVLFEKMFEAVIKHLFSIFGQSVKEIQGVGGLENGYKLQNDRMNGNGFSNDETSSGSNDDSDSDDKSILFEFGYAPGDTLMCGSRSTQPALNCTSPDPVNITSGSPYLQVLKLVMDWILSWPDVVDIINNLCNTDIEYSLKNLCNVFGETDVNITKFDKFLPEDLCFFGHPTFFPVYQHFDFTIFLNETQRNTDYRIAYVKDIIFRRNIFKSCNFDPNSCLTSRVRPWASHTRKYESVMRSKKKGRNHNTEINGAFKLTNGNLFSKPTYKRIHVICFYDVVCQIDFIKQMIWGKVFRVIVPETTLNMIDRLKGTDPIARSTGKFVETNCFPKMIGFRVQRRQDAMNLKCTPVPPGCDPQTFKYIDGVLQTGVYFMEREPPSEPVIVLITPYEFKQLFGSDDLTTLTSDQICHRNSLLKPMCDYGIKLLTMEAFRERFSSIL
ncbi:hypothetical protein RF11_01768 [Thelohanellus kitauei]|uniref:Uncharacterized protein n=1 Tax=Thelohanellus kitauei TaxID=669202 RepID=A0A0C2N1F8_THEKT|nr:hypothetical protein RF11_01768 [Thelohanellus kitauei]